MADSISIRITANIADLQEQFAQAKSSVSDFAAELGELARQAQNNTLTDAPGTMNRTAGAARRLADEIAQSDEQLALKQIAAAQQANNFDLTMGRRVSRHGRNMRKKMPTRNSTRNINTSRRRKRPTKAMPRRSNAIRNQLKSAYQDYKNQLATIDQQYLEKKRQQSLSTLADQTQANNTEYQDTVSKLNLEVNDHQISAQQRAQAETALAKTVEQQELAMLTAAYTNEDGTVTLTAAAIKQRQQIIDTFNRRQETADDQLVNEEQQRWKTLGNSIESSFNSAIDSMLFQGKTFEQGMVQIAQGVLKAFISMIEKIAEEWIEGQITALFTTKTTQQTAALSQVTMEAGVAAATAYAQWAAFPPLAEAMAADAFANTMAWGSAAGLAVGAWEIPQDMRAIIHKGEMVVPRTFAEGLRANGGLTAGGGVNLHYGPTINSREPATLAQMLARESSEMIS